MTAGWNEFADVPPGENGWVRCVDRTMLTDEQAATVARLPRRLGEVRRRLVCELGASHGGDHVAFMASSDDGDHPWWIRWSDRRCEILMIDLCPDDPDDQDHDMCLLPVEHPGPHSFDLKRNSPN